MANGLRWRVILESSCLRSLNRCKQASVQKLIFLGHLGIILSFVIQTYEVLAPESGLKNLYEICIISVLRFKNLHSADKSVFIVALIVRVVAVSRTSIVLLNSFWISDIHTYVIRASVYSSFSLLHYLIFTKVIVRCCDTPATNQYIRTTNTQCYCLLEQSYWTAFPNIFVFHLTTLHIFMNQIWTYGYCYEFFHFRFPTVSVRQLSDARGSNSAHNLNLTSHVLRYRYQWLKFPHTMESLIQTLFSLSGTEDQQVSRFCQ